MKKRRFWPWVLGVLGVVMFVVFNGRVRYLCGEVTGPFRRVGGWFGGEVSGRLWAAWRGLCDGPVRFEQAAEVERLRVMLGEYERLGVENGALREALGWAREKGRTVLAARVVAHGGGLGVWPRLTLGVGSREGVRAGDVVVVPEGLVGRVADGVERRQCEVVLLSDPACRVAAEVPGCVKGVVQGMEGSDLGEGVGEDLLYVQRPLLMRYVQKEARVLSGAEVLSEGSGGLFPKGLRIGVVGGVEREPSGLLNEVLVVPAVEPAELEMVFVLRSVGGEE